MARLRRQLDLRPGRIVCDLAAGTGKLSRLLLSTGAQVVAVEPVPGMRDQLAAACPDVEVRDGTAEAMPFADGSLDAVTVAQAFHWFDFDAALTEIRRVLRPGGGLAIVFNQRDERTEWVARWNDVIDWHARTIARYQTTDWTALLTDHGFVAVGTAQVEWEQEMTRELLAARVRSVSYIAEQPPELQQQYVDGVSALVDDQPPTFGLPYITHLWWATTPS